MMERALTWRSSVIITMTVMISPMNSTVVGQAQYSQYSTIALFTSFSFHTVSIRYLSYAYYT